MNKLFKTALSTTLILGSVPQCQAGGTIVNLTSKLTFESPVEITENCTIAMSTAPGSKSSLLFKEDSRVKGRIQGAEKSRILVLDGKRLTIPLTIKQVGKSPLDPKFSEDIISYSEVGTSEPFISSDIEIYKSYTEGVSEEVEVSLETAEDVFSLEGDSIWDIEHNVSSNAIIFREPEENNKLHDFELLPGYRIEASLTGGKEMFASLATDAKPVNIKGEGDGIITFSGNNSKAAATIEENSTAKIRNPESMFKSFEFKSGSAVELMDAGNREYNLDPDMLSYASPPENHDRGQIIARGIVNVSGGQL